MASFVDLLMYSAQTLVHLLVFKGGAILRRKLVRDVKKRFSLVHIEVMRLLITQCCLQNWILTYRRILNILALCCLDLGLVDIEECLGHAIQSFVKRFYSALIFHF